LRAWSRSPSSRFVLRSEDPGPTEPEPESPFLRLDERKAAIYENLRDLQFEYRVGKLSDQDYQNTRKTAKELASVLAEVDALKAQLAGQVAPPAPPDSHSNCTKWICMCLLWSKIRETVEVLRRVRQAHDGGPGMRTIGLFLLLSAAAMAAVTGTVVNRTTGQRWPAATVGLFILGQDGLDQVDQPSRTLQGRSPSTGRIQGPHMIRATVDAVTYNLMLPPGSPPTNLTLEVYNSSKQPGAAKVGKHMILFQPGGGQMLVNETYLCSNDGKTTWNDPNHGTVRFYLPPRADGKVSVNATPPVGLPIGTLADKTATPNVYCGGLSGKAGRDALRPQLHRALHRGRSVRGHRRQQGRQTPTSLRPTE